MIFTALTSSLRGRARAYSSDYDSNTSRAIFQYRDSIAVVVGKNPFLAAYAMPSTSTDTRSSSSEAEQIIEEDEALSSSHQISEDDDEDADEEDHDQEDEEASGTRRSLLERTERVERTC